MPPRLIVENDPAELARKRAIEKLQHPMRELAANIMRSARGSGKSYRIAENCIDVLNAVSEYRDTTGYLPSDAEIKNILSIEIDRDNLTDSNLILAYGIEEAVCGALQFAASQLLGQRLQQNAGRTQMLGGFDLIAQAREESRKGYLPREEYFRQEREPRPTKRRKRKSKS